VRELVSDIRRRCRARPRLATSELAWGILRELFHRRTLALLTLAMLCFPRSALAHECDWDRGPLGVCPCDPFDTANAAVLETTTWMMAGGGWERARDHTSSLGVLGVGAEVTVGPVLR
jgi:hypothetical protein